MVSIGDQGAQDRLLHLRGLLEVATLHGASVILCLPNRAMYRSLTLGVLRTEGVRNCTGFEQAASGCLRAAEQDPCCGRHGVPEGLQCPGVLDERRAGDLPRRGRRGCGDPQVLSVIRGSTMKWVYMYVLAALLINALEKCEHKTQPIDLFCLSH
eukprot:COSAG02_NODE_691_length_18445_cov_23.541099_14_plen_155_part_00